VVDRDVDEALVHSFLAGLPTELAGRLAGSGRRLAAQSQVGDGVRAGAAFAAEIARRVLADAPAGAWTPGRLFGPDLFQAVTGATITPLPGEPV
jgi:hypothetical protein